MRARLSTAISMKPHEPRYFTASSSATDKRLGQRVAVHLAGQAVEARQIGEPLLMIVTLVDDAHHAVRARRASVGAGEPAAIVLDPEPRRAARRRPAGSIRSGRERRCRHRGRRSASRRRSASWCWSDRGSPHSRGRCASAARSRDLQHLGGVRAPDDRVGVDAPVVGHEPDRGEDAAGIGRLGGGRIVSSGSASRTVLIPEKSRRSGRTAEVALMCREIPKDLAI